MRSLILLVTSLCTFFSVNGQNYIPFPNSGAVWAIYYHDYSADPLIDDWYSFYCTNGSDTVINNVTYTQLATCGGDYVGSIRDLEGKWYYCSYGETTEYTLYDFTAEAGDTLSNMFDTYWGNGTVISHVDTLTIGGVARRVLYTDNPSGPWIEGIGSLTGLLPCPPLSETSCQLNCFSINDSTYYTPYSSAEPLTGSCLITADIEQKSIPEVVALYPNPTSGTLACKFVRNESGIIIVRNVLGQSMAQLSFTNELIPSLEVNGVEGMYFIEVNTESGIQKMFRVIKD